MTHDEFETSIFGTFDFYFSSISLILKEEGFFKSDDEVNVVSSKTMLMLSRFAMPRDTSFNSTVVQTTSTDNKIGLIMTLAMSLLGLRDQWTDFCEHSIIVFEENRVFYN